MIDRLILYFYNKRPFTWYSQTNKQYSQIFLVLGGEQTDDTNYKSWCAKKILVLILLNQKQNFA